MDPKCLAVMSLVIVCGCMGAPGGSSNGTRVQPVAGYVANSTLLFRLYDNDVGQYASGALLCQNWSGANIPPEGSRIRKADIVVGECAVGLPYGGYALYLPLTIDEGFLALLNGTDEYVLRFNSKDFDRRYFLFVSERSVPLQGELYLDGRMIGRTDEQGVIAVNLTVLHPGNMTFRWVVGAGSPAEWDIQYIESDLKDLFIRVPADTRGTSVNPEQ